MREIPGRELRRNAERLTSSHSVGRDGLDAADIPFDCCRATGQLLLFLKKSSPHQVRVRVRLDFVVLQTRNGSVYFQNGERRLFEATDPMLPQRPMQLVHADVLPSHVGFDHLAVMD